MSQSNAMAVTEFTEGSTGLKCPSVPQSMDVNSVKFIIRMIMSELDELACTVTASERERDALLQSALDTRDKCVHYSSEYKTPTELIAAQFDALVDSWYYSLNMAAKHGVNMSRIFDVVHVANMAKRDPVTGTFIRRESDGKVIKPEGWQSPDIESEIDRQMNNGSWNSE